MSLKIIRKNKKSNALSSIRKNGFWFVDIPRTSSTSIKLQLGQKFGFAYSKNWLRNEFLFLKGMFGDHIKASRMKKIMGDELWEQTFTFSIVRNPWDRAVSLYNFLADANNPVQPIPTFREYLFEIKQEFLEGEFIRPAVFKHGCYFYLCENDKIIVDRVIKYENREEELKKISETIGFDLSPAVHHGKTQDKNGYKKHYDSETRKIIELVYAKDIEEFGYSFD